MKTVKLYKISRTDVYIASLELGLGYSLKPWGSNTLHYQGYDDGGKNYVLPEGYEISKLSVSGFGIFKGDSYCDIIVHSSGLPQLVSNSLDMPVLSEL